MQRIINLILFSLIGLNIAYVTLGAYLYPLASIDAVSIWYLKAKAFFLSHGNIPVDTLKDKLYLNSHPQYPLLVPFVFYVLYALLGGIHENIIAFINPLFYSLIIFISYKTFRKFDINTTFSLLFTYIYSMLSPLLAQGGRMHSGDADIFIVFIYWLAIYLSLNFFKNKSNLLFWIIVILIGISSQIKGEGMFLTAILIFMPVTNKLKYLSILAALSPFFIWRVFIYINQIPNDFYFIIPSITDFGSRIFDIFYYTGKEMLKLNNWYIFWPLFFSLVILGKLEDKFIIKFLVPSLSSILFLFIILYAFSSINPQEYVSSSIDRVLLQLSPLYYLIFFQSIRYKFRY